MSRADYGPNSQLVDDVLPRARTLGDDEGLALLEANRRHLVTNQRLNGALRDIVQAAFRSRRQAALARADQDGRGAVSLFPGSSRQLALAGVVGRLCETLVVVELLPPETREMLLTPWRLSIDQAIGDAVPSPNLI